VAAVEVPKMGQRPDVPDPPQVWRSEMEASDGDRAVVKVKFSYAICRRCPCHDLCTQSGRRTLTLRPRAEYEALQATRQREGTEAFTDLRAK
jgi:hypothetical protein